MCRMTVDGGEVQEVEFVSACLSVCYHVTGSAVEVMSVVKQCCLII